jgi:hypothetical protein
MIGVDATAVWKDARVIVRAVPDASARASVWEAGTAANPTEPTSATASALETKSDRRRERRVGAEDEAERMKTSSVSMFRASGRR